MPLNRAADLTPEQLFEIAFRGSCARVNLTVSVGLIEPYRNPGCRMCLSGGVGRSRNGYRVVPNRLHEDLHFFRKDISKDLLSETDRIILKTFKISL